MLNLVDCPDGMGGSLTDDQILLGCTHIYAGDALGAVHRYIIINSKYHTWEGVLRLIFCIVQHDVVPS